MDDDDSSSGRHGRQNYIRPTSSSMMRAPSWNSGFGAQSSDDTDLQEDEDTNLCCDKTEHEANISTSMSTTSNNQSSEEADSQLDPELLRQIKLRIEFEIPTVYLRRNDSSASSFHVYQIHIKTGANARWSVYKRYSQFLKFHNQLRLIEPTVKEVPFPPKKRLNSKASTIVQDRRRKLEDYMRKVSDIIASQTIVSADVECFQNLASLVNDSSSSATQQVSSELAEVGSLNESQHSEQETKSPVEKMPIASARCLFYEFITPGSIQDQTTV